MDIKDAQALIAELTRERDELAQQRGELLQRVVELEGASAWQPIETAPKDGTTVLLAAPGRVTAGEWHAEQWPTAAEYHSSTGEYLGQHETGECVEASWYSWDGGFTNENPPTGWMPLPPAPKTEGQA
jgi:hypothetical protein